MSELLMFYNSTISNLEESLKPFINKTITTFGTFHSANTSYLSAVLCNNNGYFEPNKLKCVCDFGFFTVFCKISGEQYWGKGWKWFRGIFATFYLLLSLITWYYFIMKIKNEESCLKRLQRLVLTPKYLITLNLLAISNCNYLTFFLLI